MKNIIEFFYAIRIIASPFLIGLILGFFIFLYMSSLVGLILGIGIACLGLSSGIYFLLNIKKKFQPSDFINRNARINELNSEV